MHIFLQRPTQQELEAFVDQSAHLPLSYSPIGVAQGTAAGFRLDEISVPVGTGQEAFVRAKTALAQWSHFKLGWLESFPSPASLEPGTVVAVLIRHLGFWSVNGCRVVYGVGDSGNERQFGFAYGTLKNHAEAGEEVFTVTMDSKTGEVSYRIRAASRPRAILARLGYPFTRLLQARFRRDSASAMQRAVG